MSTEQVVLLVVVALVVIGLVWYARNRAAARDPDALELERERHDAAAASEEVKTGAMLLRSCPVCNTQVSTSAETCPSCGYRFS